MLTEPDGGSNATTTATSTRIGSRNGLGFFVFQGGGPKLGSDFHGFWRHDGNVVPPYAATDVSSVADR